MTRTNRIRRAVASALVAVVVLPVMSGFEGTASAVPPPAPTLSSPANGASVTIPVTISWSQVAGAGGYNWEVSLTSGFASVLERNPSLVIGAATTQDVVSGLPNGTYFWRVQAVSTDLEPGAFSSARSFTVTGAGPGVPGRPRPEPAAQRNPVPLVGEHHVHVERRTRRGQLHPPGIHGPDLPRRYEKSPGRTFPGPTEDDLAQPGLAGQLHGTGHRRGPERPDGNAVEHGRLQRARQQPVPRRAHACRAEQLDVAAVAGDALVDARAQPPGPRIPTPDRHELLVLIDRGDDRRQRELEDRVGADTGHEVLEGAFAARLHRRQPGVHRVLGDRHVHGPLRPRCGWVRSSFPTTKFSGGEARGIDRAHRQRAGGRCHGHADHRSPRSPARASELQAWCRRAPRRSTCSSPPRDSPTRCRGMRVGFVTTPTPVTVTATYNGTSASTTITIVPPNAERHSFPAVPGQGDRWRRHAGDRGPRDRLLRRVLRRPGSAGRPRGEPVELVAGRGGAGHHDHPGRCGRGPVPDPDESGLDRHHDHDQRAGRRRDRQLVPHTDAAHRRRTR